MISEEALFERITEACAKEENISHERAQDKVFDMIQSTKRFLVEDYDLIMRDIKHKINVYLHIAVGRMRFLRNRESDFRGSVEQSMRYIMEEMTTLSLKDELLPEMAELFTIDRHEFIDEGSIRFPRKNQTIRTQVETKLEEMTPEDIEAAGGC